jgi:hypothetical protein
MHRLAQARVDSVRFRQHAGERWLDAEIYRLGLALEAGRCALAPWSGPLTGLCDRGC